MSTYEMLTMIQQMLLDIRDISIEIISIEEHATHWQIKVRAGERELLIQVANVR